jgi:polyhydroxybutyrate depolymerase
LTNAVYLPVQDSINMWVAYDVCSMEPQEWTSPSGNINRRWYCGGREGSEVVLYTIRDGGHTWPGGVPIAETGAGVQGAAPPGRMNRRIQSRFAARVGPPNREISANDLMWEFFKRHRRD